MLRHVLALATSSPWAIAPRYAEIVREVLVRRIRGGQLADEDLAPVLEAHAETEARRGDAALASGGGVAIVPIYGTLIPHASQLDQQSGATSPEAIGRMVDLAANDPNVKTILLDVNSPGGNVQGITECAAKIRAARATKQVVAVANYQMCSAAYWLASQADEIVVSPSAEIGSIGVLSMHEDISKAAEMDGVKTTFVTAGKYKAEGNNFEPLADEARVEIQARVDAVYADFTSDVSKGRGVPVATVRGASFGQGRTFLAADAVSRQMADRVATFEDTVARFQGGGRVKSRGAHALPPGYTVTAACDACGVLRCDRDEDLPLDARVAKHILSRHDCTKFPHERAARVMSTLRAAVESGKRPTFSDAVVATPQAPARELPTIDATGMDTAEGWTEFVPGDPHVPATAIADVDDLELREREFRMR